MIRDTDSFVLVNAIEALKEILVDEGGIAISSKMVIYLLNRLKELNEWGISNLIFFFINFFRVGFCLNNLQLV